MPHRMTRAFVTAAAVTLSAICFHLPSALAQSTGDFALGRGLSGLTAEQLAQAAKKSLVPPREYLFKRLNPNMTLDTYRAHMDNEFRYADTQGKGAITADNGVVLTQMAAANFRAMYIAQLLPADLDGDGVITKDEFRRWYSSRLYSSGAKPIEGKTAAETIEEKTKEAMALDTDHDGRITFAELMQKAVTLPYPLGGLVVYQLLTLAPDGETTLTRADFEAAVERQFHDVDTNGDGVVSADELQHYRVSRAGNSPH